MFRIKFEGNVVTYINENIIRMLVHDPSKKKVTIIELDIVRSTEFEKVIEVERID